ncbi:MAG TPA: fibrillarin-like rRNA/tRNA 2'-O-methyltransferase [Thermoplasmata archaeon]
MSKTMMRVEGLQGVYTDSQSVYTLNAARGHDVYGEELVVVGDAEYRRWDPRRSKLAAVVLLGFRNLGLDESTKVLYLGAASGTTASHVSDIVQNGVVYCVEVSERSFRDLVKVCETRRNMIPVLANASMPEEYSHMIEGIELVYQDIAQRDQVDIFVRNMAAFDAERGILMLKARSINVNRDPKDVFSEARKLLVSKQLKIKQVLDIGRYAKDHAAFIVEA